MKLHFKREREGYEKVKDYKEVEESEKKLE